jgi:hypothetical protein
MKYRDTERMTTSVERLVEIIEDNAQADLLEKLLATIEVVPLEGMTRQQVWRIEQAKSRVRQRLCFLSAQ